MRFPTVQLSEVAKFANGGTPSRKRPEFYEGHIPWITGADIMSSGATITAARSHITDEAVRRSATCVVDPGTVLLVTRTSVGKVGIAGVPLAINQDITAIRPDQGRLDRDYLVRALQRLAHHFERRAQGATIQGINREVVATAEIPLPPIEEQRQIAAVLDAAEALRAKRRKALAKFEILTKAIFIDMFGNPIDMQGLTTPMHCARLGELAAVRTGKLDANASSPAGKYPFFTCAVEPLRIDVAAFDAKAVLVAGNGDLNVKYYEGKFNAYQRTYVICSLDESIAHPRFLYGFLNIFVEKLRHLAIGGVIKYIKLGNLTDAIVPLPNGREQAEYLDRVGEVERLRQAMEVSLKQTGYLLTSLQQRAFRGEL